jgi:hypothetical protein
MDLECKGLNEWYNDWVCTLDAEDKMCIQNFGDETPTVMGDYD